MDHYLDRLKNGTLKLHALEKELPVDEAVRVRRAFIEREAGVPLPCIGDFTFDPSRAVQRNIENMIGATQIPVGVAGPLQLHGNHAQG
ncbi:MAG: 3-hydroxy-3-methylglutaryl-CoA reductase, partial [Methanomicrobiales archaeon]|nr:3-hydroxy-3-methylglutaryl-CoA reductase [Methanomicrobiales archaeon]